MPVPSYSARTRNTSPQPKMSIVEVRHRVSMARTNQGVTNSFFFWELSQNRSRPRSRRSKALIRQRTFCRRAAPMHKIAPKKTSARHHLAFDSIFVVCARVSFLTPHMTRIKENITRRSAPKQLRTENQMTTTKKKETRANTPSRYLQRRPQLLSVPGHCSNLV